MVLQLDGKCLAGQIGFLFVHVDMVGPILREVVKLAHVVIHTVVPLLQVKKLLHLVVLKTR
jgi:hypothetical protein